MLLLPLAALAAPFGSPDPAGTVQVSVQGAADAQVVWQEGETESGSPCSASAEECRAWSQRRAIGGRLTLQLGDSLTVWGEAGLVHPTLTNGLEQPDPGLGLAAGGALVLPKTGPRPALMVEVELQPPTGAGASVEGRRLELAPVMVGGSPMGGVVGWVGPTVSRSSLDYLCPDCATDAEGAAADLTLRLPGAIPVGLVVGGEATSTGLGLPWRPVQARLATGLELRLIDVWGANAWVGLSF